MCTALRRGRAAGRRDSLVVVAEGAKDREGRPITSAYVRQVIEDTLHEDARVTILGHVQRGGSPSAYDRWASTWLGYEAVQEVLAATPDTAGPVIGFRGNRVTRVPLVEAVAQTRSVPDLIAAGDYEAAMGIRGGSFREAARILAELVEPSRIDAPEEAKRIAIIHAGGLARSIGAAPACRWPRPSDRCSRRRPLTRRSSPRCRTRRHARRCGCRGGRCSRSAARSRTTASTRC
ncbi:MAG: 6-phosphofructokinase, partial [Actinobacteria bacterium]|nr:6-phosphofructokinase [Actinomycetota bacterium]